MSKFKTFLSKGEFRVPLCTTCRERVWPPFEICPVCLSRTIFRRISRKGTLREYSTTFASEPSRDFGIVDLGGIHLLGSLEGDHISPGCKVVMYNCGIDSEGHPFFKFKTGA